MGVLLEKAIEIIEVIKKKNFKIDNVEDFCKKYNLTNREFEFLYNCSKPKQETK